MVDHKLRLKLTKRQTSHYRSRGRPTADEVNKYINEGAFSGAEEFLEQYKDSAKDSGIIGHLVSGFSAFMVAKKVEIITKSYKDEPAAHWTCDGSPSLLWKNMIKLIEEQKSFYTSIRIPKHFGRVANSVFAD